MKRYKNLIALLTIVCFAIFMVCMGAPVASAIAVVGLWQLSQFAMSKRSRRCYAGVLTEEQIRELTDVTGKCAKFVEENAEMFKGVKDLAGIAGGFAAIKALPEALTTERKRVDELQGTVGKLQKQLAKRNSPNGVRWVGNKAFVSDECALALAGMYMIACNIKGVWNEKILGPQEVGMAKAAEWLGIEVKTAMTTTQAPLPTEFVGQVIELVIAYGVARQYATVYPLGAGTTKLPRLTAGEDDFGYLGVGTAGQSQTISEKRVGVTEVSFTPSKFGGIIRIPTELESDTYIQLGQFLARYIARQFAKMEDKTLFIGDGTATYANISGIAAYCLTNTAYLLQLAAGKTKPSDATLDDWRNLRNLVNAAVLGNMAAAGETSAAYYAHPSWDTKFVTYNTVNQPFNYQRGNALAGARLDGFPVRWSGALQPYGTAVAASKQLGVFGDLNYWFLGERGSARIEVSKEVYFVTDELGMRALERIDVQAMATDAVASLQTPAV